MTQRGISADVRDAVMGASDNVETSYFTQLKICYLMTFLDTLLVRREDGSVKLLVYRKKSHRCVTSFYIGLPEL